MWARVQSRVAGSGMVAEQVICDVSKRAAVDALIDEHGANLAGIVHAAGILRDNTFAQQTHEDFEAVFAPKAAGAVYFHEALERVPNDLKFFWVFSSVATLGSRGQSNYSSANAFLNGFARHRVARNKPCCSIMWGAWDEAGMAANLPASVKKRYNDGPLPFFSNEEALRGLDEALTTGLPCVGCWKQNAGALKGLAELDEDAAYALYSRTFYSRIAPLECYFSYPYDWMDEYTASVDYEKMGEETTWQHRLVKPHFKFEEITTGRPGAPLKGDLADMETLDSTWAPGQENVRPLIDENPVVELSTKGFKHPYSYDGRGV